MSQVYADDIDFGVGHLRVLELGLSWSTHWLSLSYLHYLGKLSSIALAKSPNGCHWQETGSALLLSYFWGQLTCTHTSRDRSSELSSQYTGTTLPNVVGYVEGAAFPLSHPKVWLTCAFTIRTSFKVFPRLGAGPASPSSVAGKGSGQIADFHDPGVSSPNCLK